MVEHFASVVPLIFNAHYLCLVTFTKHEHFKLSNIDNLIIYLVIFNCNSINFKHQKCQWLFGHYEMLEHLFS